jgi:hypothetical protein
MNDLTAFLAAVEWGVVYQIIGKLITLLACLYCCYVMGNYGYALGLLSALLLAGTSTLLCLFFAAFTWAFIHIEPVKSLIGIIGAVCVAMVV